MTFYTDRQFREVVLVILIMACSLGLFFSFEASEPPEAPVKPEGVLRYGFPGTSSGFDTTIAFAFSVDRASRNPHWVAEHITRSSLSLNGNATRKNNFHEDPRLPPLLRAKNVDYLHSGFDRGHMMPAADAMWSQEAVDSTFLLSNSAPQVGEGFNRQNWAYVESFCRGLTASYASVRIVTGPLYLPRRDANQEGRWHTVFNVIGNPPNIAVPTRFFKFIYAEDQVDYPIFVALASFVLPNAAISDYENLGDFEVSIENLQKASRLMFVPKLSLWKRQSLCKQIGCDILKE